MLQRKRFDESYTHTNTNQSATVPWEFRLSEVEVSVKLTEVVYPRLKKTNPNQLKTQGGGEETLSRSVIDEDVHAVVFMIDPRKRYTLEYAQREIARFEYSP